VKRLLAKWAQYRIETAMLAAGFLGLIVNLTYMQRFLPTAQHRIIVLVDSRREAILLRFLHLTAVIPRFGVRVIKNGNEFRALAENSSTGGTLLAATARLYAKHYTSMLNWHRSQRLIVL
jgi:hypothetical protein